MDHPESTPNENYPDASPWYGIFHGQWGLVLMGSILIDLLIYSGLSKILDFMSSIIVSCLPSFAATAFVVFCVNGKAPSYASDLLLVIQFHVLSFLYHKGIITKPPQLWKKRLREIELPL